MLVHKLRLQRGWSQEQLAEVSGLSVRTVQRIESGKTASLESMNALSAVFETDLTQLIEIKEKNMPILAQPVADASEAMALADVRRIKRFYIRLILYATVIGALAVINLMTTPQRLWVQWSALTWGAVLIVSGLYSFDRIPFLNAAWERKQVEKRLGRAL